MLTNRREFLAAAAGAALAPGLLRAVDMPGESHRRPNIIVLFIDDLGLGDVGVYGCPDIPTPHIDALAQQGVRCTNGYTLCPVCSPSRTGLMTGMYPQRFGVNGNVDRGAPIPADHPTLAECLRDAGYVTGMVGRWDVGAPPQGPLDRGFMEVARRSFIESDDPLRALPNGPTYYQQDGVYWTDRQAGEMVDFVTRHRHESFFLYFAPLAIHFPVQEAPAKYLNRVPTTIHDQRRRELAATLIAADDAIGLLMNTIRELGLDEETLVMFTGDNGGWAPDHARNLPSRGGKATEWDGGVHEPFIVRWCGTLPAGQTFDGLVSTLDIYATAAAVARTDLPERCEGVNLLPYLKGQRQGDPHEILYWRWLERGRRDMHALRRGRYRLMRDVDHDDWRLYDLEADPGESNDLAAAQPERVKELARAYQAWAGELPGPSGLNRQPGGICPTGIGWATPDNP